MDVVEIDVGFDPFHAQVIADHCADEGVHGELLIYDQTRYELGSAARVQNRFVCRIEDESNARLVIADLYPELTFGDHGLAPPPQRRPVSRKTRVIGALMGLAFIGPLIVAGAWQFGSLIF